MEKTTITMKYIAREFGVSVATVSRALAGSPHISKARREQIQQFAREHNFYPNAIAAQLRQSHTTPSKIIGVIVPQFAHYYFASILDGIEQESSARGYRILVAQSDEQYNTEVQICESFYQNKVCGIIVSQAKDTTQYDHFRQLIDAGVPLVFYDRICAGINTSRVVVDDYMGAFNAVSHLIRTGCRRIAFFGTTMNIEIAKNRLNGYKDAIYQNGLTPDDSLIIQCDNRQDAELITPNILKRKDRPDAFFAVNDETAIGILYATKKFGLKVPQDISICGFTNVSSATACSPMLTTVEQRGVEVGKEAADILIDFAEGKTPPEQVVKCIVKTRLVIRGTTRPLPEEPEK